MVKRLPAMWETQVQSLCQEDLLEKEMATHSSTLAGKFHGRRSLVGCSPWGCKDSDTTERLQCHVNVMLMIINNIRHHAYCSKYIILLNLYRQFIR